MLLRAGEYQSALRDLGSRTEADRLGLARTAMALRDAIFASDEASDDEAAALADEPPFEPSQADLANGEHLRDTVDGYEAATEALLDQDTRMRLPDYTRPITAPRDHDPVGDDDDDHESEGGGHASH